MTFYKKADVVAYYQTFGFTNVDELALAVKKVAYPRKETRLVKQYMENEIFKAIRGIPVATKMHQALVGLSKNDPEIVQLFTPHPKQAKNVLSIRAQITNEIRRRASDLVKYGENLETLTDHAKLLEDVTHYVNKITRIQ